MNKQIDKQTDKKKMDVWGWMKGKTDDKKAEGHECCGGEGGCCGSCEEDHEK